VIAWITSVYLPPWLRTVLIYAAIIAAIGLTILRIRKSGEKMGRLAEQLERSYDLERLNRNVDEAIREVPRPDRSTVHDRLRDGSF